MFILLPIINLQPVSNDRWQAVVGFVRYHCLSLLLEKDKKMTQVITKITGLEPSEILSNLLLKEE
jgi:hypothetical protein